MPIINITEQDLTYTPARDTTDIPLILSVTKRPSNVEMFPKMYKSVTAFKGTEESINIGLTCPWIDEEETKHDSAYIMALQLIDRQMPVYYGYVEDLADADFLDYIQDKNEVTIKYICVPDMNTLVFGEAKTESESPSLSLKNKLLGVCKNRGDCVFLVDCDRTFDYKEILDVQLHLNNKGTADAVLLNHEFGSAFAPWHSFNLSTPVKAIKDEKEDTVINAVLPGSYSYLSALHEATKTANNWLAIAGVARGAVPGIGTAQVAPNRIITNTVANKLQAADLEQDATSFAINPITRIAPYGSIIWGNRTLKTIEGTNIKATHFLNTRNMISDIKKVAYNTAKTLMFNQNDEILWLDFLAGVTPFLERLKSGSGIFDYKLIKKPTTERHKFACEIRIYPVSAVEWFDISVVASDMAVETEEK